MKPADSPILDRAQGCLLGLAIGDALGAPVEFSKPGSFEEVTDYRDGGVFDLKAGQYTDDSSMALCLGISLIEKQGMDLNDQMNRYLRWLRLGENSSTGECFDCGEGTVKALAAYEATGSFSPAPDSAGNGCLMRLAPVAIRYLYNSASARKNAILSASPTHAAEEALQATEYLGWLLSMFIQGTSPRPPYTYSRTLAEITQGPWDDRSVMASGYCLHSLEAALWAFHTTTSFEECVLKAVNLGDDADTVGAIAGQIAGSYYGISDIPARFILGLQDSDRFKKMAEQLVLNTDEVYFEI